MNKNKVITSAKRMSSFIRSFDLFGEQVNLVVKEKDIYTSLLGSAVSLAIIAFTSFSFI